MFRRKRKKTRKIEVNTDGDELPIDVVKRLKETAKSVGASVVDDVKDSPDFLIAMRQATDNRGKPGPEDILLLYLYGKSAVDPDTAISVPEGEENENYIFYLYSDDYIAHVGNKVYVTYRGVVRLKMLGAIDDKGRIILPK